MAEISLNTSMRSNLLSLQQTQKLQNSTQLRLSTGLKVNSAIDNPSSYYTASALNNRAEDLSALLDAMSQGIQTIKAANEALETGTAVLQQAKAAAVKASENSVDIVAKVNTEAELLSAVEKGGPGYIVISSDIHLSSQIQLKDGQKLVGDNYFAEYNGANHKLTFDFDGIDSHAILTADNSEISNLDIDYQTDQNYAFTVIRSQDVNNVKISNINISAEAPNITDKYSRIIGFFNATGKLDGDININSLVSTTGYGVSLNASEVDMTGNLNIKTNGSYGYGIYAYNGTANLYGNINVETAGINSYGLNTHYGATINIYGNVNVKALSSFAILNGRSIADTAGSTMNIYASAQLYLETGGAYAPISSPPHHANVAANTLFIEKGTKIGGKDNLGTFFSEAKADIRKTNTSETSSQNLKSDFFSDPVDFTALTPWTPFDFSSMAFNQTFNGNQETSVNKSNNKSYTEIISQYDQLVNDASYKGVNLLEQNNLKINFNEERSSGIEINGVDASAKAIGVHTLNWESRMDIQNSIEELENAINKLRDYSSQFGNYYSIVNTREDFTENLINVLTEGADKLTLADMNAESANMLALQTRQQLAINSLSLASQAAQSVLKLF